MIWGDILLLFSPFWIMKLNSNLSPTKRRHVKSFTVAHFLMGNQIHWDEWKITFVNSRIITLCAVWRRKWWVSEECETGNLLVIEWKGAIFVVIIRVTTKLNWMIDVLMVGEKSLNFAIGVFISYVTQWGLKSIHLLYRTNSKKQCRDSRWGEGV